MAPVAIRRTAIGLILAGALLRFHDLDGRSVWHDEAFGILRAARPAAADVIAAPPLVEPPGWPLALRIWLRDVAGVDAPGPAAVLPARAFSAACGALALVPAWVVLRALLPASAALGALALLAASPFAILCAQQARPYALRVLLEWSAVAGLLQALRAGAGAPLAGAALCAAAAGVVHYVALAWVPAAVVFLALRRRPLPGGRVRWVTAGALALAPGALLALRARAAIGHATAAAPQHVGVGAWLTGAVQQFGAGAWIPGPLAGPAFWLFAAAAVAGFGIAGLRLIRTGGAAGSAGLSRDAGAALVAFGAVPPLLLLCAHQTGVVYQPKIRYAAGAHLFLLAAVAAGPGLLPWRRARPAGLAALLVLELAALHGWYGGGFPALDLPPCLKPHRDAAALIIAGREPGDAVAAFEFSAYTPQKLLLPAGLPVTYLLRDPLSPDAELDDVGHPMPLDELARTARRIWLVVAPVHYRDPLDVPDATLAALHRLGRLESDETLPGIRLQRWRVLR